MVEFGRIAIRRRGIPAEISSDNVRLTVPCWNLCFAPLRQDAYVLSHCLSYCSKQADTLRAVVRRSLRILRLTATTPARCVFAQSLTHRIGYRTHRTPVTLS